MKVPGPAVLLLLYCGITEAGIVEQVNERISKFAGEGTSIVTGGVNRVTEGVSKGIASILGDTCSRDVKQDFRQAMYEFSAKLYKQLAKRYNDHFVVSQYSIWLALAGIAEAASGKEQDELFEVLHLPQEECLRQKYYEIATSLEDSVNDVTLSRKRILVVDEDVALNATWSRAVREAGLLDTLKLPLKTNSTNSLNEIRKLINADIPDARFLDGKGAVLIDSLDYTGFWTTAFTEADIEPDVPFYNGDNKQVGTVDMMKIRKRVKLAYLPFLHAKVLELPVGNGGRYKMLFIMNLNGNLRRTVEIFRSTTIIDIFHNLLESTVPLEVAIPRFALRTELDDMKSPLVEMGVDDLWQQPCRPGNLVQRVSVTVSHEGLSPAEGSAGVFSALSSAATGVASTVGREFTGNKPFMFALVDADTKTCLFMGSFSAPPAKSSTVSFSKT